MPENNPLPSGRPPEIEDLTNRLLFHPLADTVVAVAMRLRLSANTLSLLGMICGIAAAWTYYHLPRPGYVLTGLALMLVWHVLDGADGRLARRTGTASASGRVLDGLCDHVTFIAVYSAFTLTLIEAGWPPIKAWGLALTAGFSHALQSAGYEARRHQYVRRLRKPGMTGSNVRAVTKASTLLQGMAHRLAAAYARLQVLQQRPASPVDQELQRLWHSGGDAGRRQALQLAQQTRTLVKAWSVFNPNKRTILIAVTAALNLPAVYFVIELTLLNLLLMFLLLCERHYETALLNSFQRRLQRTAG